MLSEKLDNRSSPSYQRRVDQENESYSNLMVAQDHTALEQSRLLRTQKTAAFRVWYIVVCANFLFAEGISTQVPPLTEPVTGQMPTLMRGSNLADPSALSVGLSAGLVSATKEAFIETGKGYSANGFFGFAMKPLHEFRFGVSLVDVPESLRSGRVRSVSIYIEPYLSTKLSSTAFRFAPRIARMWEWRDIFVHSPLNGWGGGATAGILHPVSTRLSVEAGATFTSYFFGPADLVGSITDPDQESQANILEFRIGAVFRLKKGASKVEEAEIDDSWR